MVHLERFTGNWDALHEVAMDALKSLQSCCCEALHGDLKPGNFLANYAIGKCSTVGLFCNIIYVITLALSNHSASLRSRQGL